MVIDFSTLYEKTTGIERLFEDLMRYGSSYQRALYPQVNIHETDTAFFIDINIPGVPAEDIDLTLTAKNLIIKGDRKTPEGRYYCQERVTGAFQRILNLNVPVDRDNVSAKCENGIVRVTLPKTNGFKPRKIFVAE